MSAEGAHLQVSVSSERRWAKPLGIAAIAAWLFPWIGAAYTEATVLSFVFFGLTFLRQHLLHRKERATAVERTSSDPELDKHKDLVHVVWVVLGLASNVDDPLQVVFVRDSRTVLDNWFRELESASRSVCREDISLLLHIARRSARHGCGRLLERALDCMDRLDIQATVHLYTDIISRRGNSGDYTGAKMWYERMQRAGLTGDVLVYSTLINGAGKSGNLEEAEFWFRTMIKKRLSPSVVTINSLINACSRSKLPDLGEHWLQVMIDMGLSPTVITYNSIITGFANAGQSERAEFWLTEMMRQGISPDSVSYGAILHSLIKTLETPSDPMRAMQAHRLMTQLVDRGLLGKRPSYTYKCVISVCAVARQFELAEYWIDQAEASGVKLKPGDYRFLQRAYENGNMRDAAGRIVARRVRARAEIAATSRLIPNVEGLETIGSSGIHWQPPSTPSKHPERQIGILGQLWDSERPETASTTKITPTSSSGSGQRSA